MSTYLTSDIHYGHKNLIEGLRHMSVEENNELIIKNINDIVKQKDSLIILGDLTMDKPMLAIEFLDRLQCKNVTVVAGNHDTPRVCRAITPFATVVGMIQKDGFAYTHCPVHESQLDFSNRYNIHGHIHVPGQIEYEPGKMWTYIPDYPCPAERYYNVNLEFHDYKPIALEEIRDYFKLARH